MSSNLGKPGIYTSIQPISGPTPDGVFLNFPIGQQYTSFGTGSEGQAVQGGFFNTTNPAYPLITANLDRTLGANYWWRLVTALTVGGNSNVFRFVDVDGLQNWGAANNKSKITIDKFTGLGFYRITADLPAAGNWATIISAARTFSVVVNGVTFNNFWVASRESILALFGEITENGPGNIEDPVSIKTIWNKNGASNEFWTSTIQSNSGGANAYSKGWNPSTYIRGVATANNFLPFYIFDARALISI